MIDFQDSSVSTVWFLVPRVASGAIGSGAEVGSVAVAPRLACFLGFADRTLAQLFPVVMLPLIAFAFSSSLELGYQFSRQRSLRVPSAGLPLQVVV